MVLVWFFFFFFFIKFLQCCSQVTVDKENGVISRECKTRPKSKDELYRLNVLSEPQLHHRPFIVCLLGLILAISVCPFTIEHLTNCTIEHYSSSGPVLYLFISCLQQSYFLCSFFVINKYLFAFLKDYMLPELFWTLWGFFRLCQQPYESYVSCFANSCLFDDWFHLFQQKQTEEQITVEKVKVPCCSGVARSSFIWKHTLPAKADAFGRPSEKRFNRGSNQRLKGAKWTPHWGYCHWGGHQCFVWCLPTIWLRFLISRLFWSHDFHLRLVFVPAPDWSHLYSPALLHESSLPPFVCAGSV